MKKLLLCYLFIFLATILLAQEASVDSVKLYTLKGDSIMLPLQKQSSNKDSAKDTVRKKKADKKITFKGDSDQQDTVAVGKTKIILNNEQPAGDKKDSKISNFKDLLSFQKIFWSLLLLALTYIFIKAVIYIINKLSERNTSKRISFKRFAPFVSIIAWSLSFFIIVYGIFSPSFETFFAVAASIGIAVGIAAQDILKNIFGGIMIIFDRPFQLGDKIQVGENYGEVKEIGLRSCRLLTKDDSLVSVPNAEIITQSVSNTNNGEPNCQVVAEIYLPIDIDTNMARQIATEAAQVSRYIFLNKPITVLFVNEVKEKRSFLKMRLKAYVSDIRYEFNFQSDMTEIVIAEFIKQKLIDKKDLM